MTSAMWEGQNFESLNMEHVNIMDIKSLLTYFADNTYGAKAGNAEGNQVLHCCIKLLELDYSLILVDNTEGYLSSHYPSQIPILEYEKAISGPSAQRTTNTIYENIYKPKKFKKFFNKAKEARCRQRFPIPTILYKSKYVCRSSTLAGGPEMYSRHYLLNNAGDTYNNSSDDETDSSEESDSYPQGWHLFDIIRYEDIKLLKKLNVGTIIDLMVEKKKVKFGMNVTSSEKVDKENRYSDFDIISFPYPGCEFFKTFRDNNFNAEGLIFDWNQDQCDATVSIPDNLLLSHLKIEWNNYKEWDLIRMTQNYTKYLLKYLQESSSGILIHCISGWDRTPLFISLLRLSLWADGLAHQKLDEHQILYLTVAYDWLLFGHRLSDRLQKGEDIFFFCFYILKYLTSDEYSIAPGRHKIKKHSEKIAEDKTDSDSQLELLLEQELRGSNISLNSISSTISNKSQDPAAVNHHNDEYNGNPGYLLDIRDSMALGASASPQSRRTSPVTVPAGTRLKRAETSLNGNSFHSNNSIGSWNLVTETGSLRGSDSTFADGPFTTVVDGDETLQEPLTPVFCRKTRLLKVRELFYGCYFSSIGSRNVRFGPDSSLGAIFGNIAERVGFTQRS